MNDKTPGGEKLENSDAYYCFRGVYSARRMLDIGFTTIFDGGGNNLMDVAMRECIKTGLFDAPDYYISGQQITAGRGHMPGIGIEAHGEWEVRKAVRTMLWWGVGHIKMKMSAPMRMPGRNTERSEFTIPEIQAACDEAHSAGLLVGAHAQGADPIKDFIRGGGDRVIHGTNIDDEGIELILKKDQYVYATISSPARTFVKAVHDTKPPTAMELMTKQGHQHFNSAKKMYEAGVKLAFSTDTGGMGIFPGQNFNEMLYMKEIGMSNLEILRSATSEAAKAVQVDKTVGSVKPGLKANLIVLEKSPLEDMEQAKDVRMVIKAGKVVRNKLPIAIPF
jgi:imidazolonepropionase-like amidohydrolase